MSEGNLNLSFCILFYFDLILRSWITLKEKLHESQYLLNLPFKLNHVIDHSFELCFQFDYLVVFSWIYICLSGIIGQLHLSTFLALYRVESTLKKISSPGICLFRHVPPQVQLLSICSFTSSLTCSTGGYMTEHVELLNIFLLT